MPSLFGASPSSSSEQIIPEDFTPRSLASLMTIPLGMTAPGKATGTVWPAATLGAPQTMVRAWPSAVSTTHTDR